MIVFLFLIHNNCRARKSGQMLLWIRFRIRYFLRELIGPKVEWEPDFFGHEWRKIEIWVGSTHFGWAPPILSGLQPLWVSALSASVRRVKMCKFCFLLLLKHSKNLLPFQKITENQLENARINKQARQRRRPKSRSRDDDRKVPSTVEDELTNCKKMIKTN